MNNRFVLLFLLLISFLSSQSQKIAFVKDEVNWRQFLDRHNLHWDSLSANWNDGAFTGNGLLGVMIYKEDAKAMRFDIGRTDVTDHREGFKADFGKSRLPIGRFVLKTVGDWKKASMRINLWNAEATGSVLTTKGSLKWRNITHATSNVVVIEITAKDGEEGFQWQWIAEESISPRARFKPKPSGYTANPPYKLGTKNGISICEQTLLAGGQYTTAWKEKRIGKKSYLYITVGNSFPTLTATQEAVTSVSTALQHPVNELIDVHRKWWHQYYPESFVSVPDTRLENYYWIQQYKLASAMRDQQPATDVLGPWLAPTPWPAFWWNLNVQLTYYPVYSSNRLHLGESLIRTLNANAQNLIGNVPEKYRYNSAGIGRVSSYDCIAQLDVENGQTESDKEIGNLTWALHNYWQHAVYNKDDSLLVHGLFPLLRRSINYYIHLLKSGTDEMLHLPPTASPEYGLAPDCNYDLALLRWGCTALLDINIKFRLKDPMQVQWQQVLDNLTPYPTDMNGLMIGRGVPFDKSHRHYSHLLMIYPLRLINWEQPLNRALIERSLTHWMSMPEALAGYSFTGASSISSAMGKGNDAVRYLHKMLDQHSLSNTMYREAGPVIETPLSVVTSMNEMLLQSWGGIIRVFPAVHTAWKDVAFDKLRTEGAFLVTAARKNQLTKFIMIKSLKGGLCTVKHDIPDNDLLITSNSPSIHNKPGLISLQMKAGEVLILFNKDFKQAKIEPVKAEGALNQFGLKKKETKLTK